MKREEKKKRTQTIGQAMELLSDERCNYILGWAEGAIEGYGAGFAAGKKAAAQLQPADRPSA